MLNISKKQYFLFDLDGTLVDLEQLNYKSFVLAVEKYAKRELSFADYMKYIAGVGSVAGLRSFLQSIGMSKMDVMPVVETYRANKFYYLDHDFDSVVTIKPGLVDFLTRLREQGKHTAVGTSTAKKFAMLILEKSGLLPYFEHVVTVDDVAHTKPAPDIFFRALDLLNGTKEGAIIFEDSPNGVACAKNTRIDFIVVHNKGKNDAVAEESENTITNYTELKI